MADGRICLDSRGAERLRFGTASVVCSQPSPSCQCSALPGSRSMRSSTQRDEGNRVAMIENAVAHLVARSELRTRILDERNWSAAIGGLEQLGLSPQAVQLLTGIDIPTQSQDARARVDALLAAEGLADLAERVADIRLDTVRTLTQTGDAYLEVEASVARLTDALLDSVLTQATSVSDGGALVNGLRIVEQATLARQAMSSEFNNFFESQFLTLTERADEVRSLIAKEGARSEAIGELQRIAPPGSSTQRAIGNLAASSAVRSFETDVNVLIDKSLAGAGVEVPLATLLADLQGVARAFEASSVATDLYFDLVDAAGEDVRVATRYARGGR